MWNSNFVNLNINGDTINGPGFLFTVRNTTHGDGAFSSFVTKPDGDFANAGVLTAGAETALAGAQPYGMFEFGAELPGGSGLVTSAPAGFNLNVQPSGVYFHSGVASAIEINFLLNLASLDGLLFDDATPAIPGLFTNTRGGSLSFFISTPVGNSLLDNLLDEDGGIPAINMATEMAWEEGGVLKTKFNNVPGISNILNSAQGTGVRPRGQMIIPSPPGVALGVLGLGLLGVRRRR